MTTAERPGAAASVALAGLLSLAVAMGIGRFAFTPVLPLMVRDGLLDVASGGWLAAANYVGYFVGAILAARIRISAAVLAVASLAAIASSTAAMCFPGFGLWIVLRLIAGICSAGVFVATSVWCLGTLARLNRQELSGWVYAGVGAGITIAGLYCLYAGIHGVRSQLAWLHLGLLALAMSVPIYITLRALNEGDLTGGRSAPSKADRTVPAGTHGIVVSYGVMGLGYILPATFLPVMARSVIPDPSVFGLAWPIFGLTAAVSTLIAGAVMRRASRLQVWSVCQLLMGVGALLPSLSLNGGTILMSAVLVGGTFMVITLAGVQEIRARVSWNPGPWVGYMTAAFALGQIAGPAASATLLALPDLADRALAWCLQFSAVALFITAAWLWIQGQPKTSTKELNNV